MQGKVIKLENKLAVIKSFDTSEIIKCNLKGKFKRDKINVIVGDIVEITKNENDIYGIIEKVHERKNSLIRPSVSNIDQILLTFAISMPELNQELLDTFLCVIENKGIDIILCFTKNDLNPKKGLELKEYYEKVGYKVILSSTIQNQGFDEIKKELKDRTTALAGPSGVGKSSILNKVFNEQIAEVGDLSEKIQRGKNTTKAVELMELKDGGYVLDTPGFTTIDLLDIDDENLEYTFKEFLPYLGKCKFTGCAHITEPECSIKRAVANNAIHLERYERYKRFFEKLKDRQNAREKSNKNYKGKKVYITSRDYNKMHR